MDLLQQLTKTSAATHEVDANRTGAVMIYQYKNAASADAALAALKGTVCPVIPAPESVTPRARVSQALSPWKQRLHRSTH